MASEKGGRRLGEIRKSKHPSTDPIGIYTSLPLKYRNRTINPSANPDEIPIIFLATFDPGPLGRFAIPFRSTRRVWWMLVHDLAAFA